MLALQDFRGNVIGSSTNRALLLAIMLQLRSKTKVPDLDTHICIQEEIPKLQVSMNNAAIF